MHNLPPSRLTNDFLAPSSFSSSSTASLIVFAPKLAPVTTSVFFVPSIPSRAAPSSRDRCVNSTRIGHPSAFTRPLICFACPADNAHCVTTVVARLIKNRFANPGNASGFNNTTGTPRFAATYAAGPAAYPPSATTQSGRCSPNRRPHNAQLSRHPAINGQIFFTDFTSGCTVCFTYELPNPDNNR